MTIFTASSEGGGSKVSRDFLGSMDQPDFWRKLVPTLGLEKSGSLEGMIGIAPTEEETRFMQENLGREGYGEFIPPKWDLSLNRLAYGIETLHLSGSPTVFSFVYWAGSSTRYATILRITFSVEFQLEEIAPFQEPVLNPFDFSDFGARLQLIGLNLLLYRHLVDLSPDLIAWAKDICGVFGD